MGFVAIILVFLAYTSTSDIDFTFSKRGKAIYKTILVNADEDDHDDSKADLFIERAGQTQKRRPKRRHETTIKRGPESVFHFICLIIGIYFAMLFTSWTSIYEHDFDTSIVASNFTLWMRFGGTLTGTIYTILVSVLNIKESKKYK